MPSTEAQADNFWRLLVASELLHHWLMARMSDPGFDLLETGEPKEALDAEIGRFLPDAVWK
jgi:hypothetical protein